MDASLAVRGGTPPRAADAAVLAGLPGAPQPLPIRVVATATALLAAAQWTTLLPPTRGVAVAALLVAGWAFLIGGLLVAWQRPGRFAVLLLVIAACFVMPSLQYTRIPVLWTAGTALDSLFALPLVWLAVTFPHGRLTARVDRALVGVVVAILVSGVGLATLFDPAAMGCVDCPDGLNLLLVRPDPELLTLLVRALMLTVAVSAAAVGGRLVLRLARATPPARRVLAPVAVPASAWFLLHAVTRIVRHFTDIVWAGTHPVSIASTFLLAMIPFGVAVGLLRERARRSRVGDLVVELGELPPSPGMRDAIARTLGDPAAEVGFWVDDTQRYVTPTGEPLRLPAPGSGREATHVEGRGTPLAVIVHDAALLDEPRLMRAVSAAARFAVENERLRADLLAELEVVRASRARIVEAGDVERRRIERNLHDGAQQQLLALALQLRSLGARPDVDQAVRDEVDAAVDSVRAALGDLRDLAQGLHPSVLAAGGLAAALTQLADRAPCPVDVDVDDAALPDAVQATAYYVVAEGLANIAKHARATRARVHLRLDGDRAVVRVVDDGVGGAALDRGTGLRGLDDRVAAAGGELRLDSRPGTGTVLQAALPLT